MAYQGFLELFDVVFQDAFWHKEPELRFVTISKGFAIYAELLHYPPIKWFNEHLRRTRPPIEAEMAEELFPFVRNIIAHFPFFNCWDEVFINRRMVNWQGKSKSIDKFLTKNEGREEASYRFWEESRRKMTYMSIRYAYRYCEGENVYLKDILNEEAGVKFAYILMRKVLSSQIEAVSSS